MAGEDKKSRKDDKKSSRREREEKPEKKSRRDKEPREESKRDAEKVEVKPEPEDEGARRGGGGKAAAPKDEKIEISGVKRDQPEDDDVDVDDYDEARLDEVLPEESGTPGPAVRCMASCPTPGSLELERC